MLLLSRTKFPRDQCCLFLHPSIYQRVQYSVEKERKKNKIQNKESGASSTYGGCLTQIFCQGRRGPSPYTKSYFSHPVVDDEFYTSFFGSFFPLFSFWFRVSRIFPIAALEMGFDDDGEEYDRIGIGKPHVDKSGAGKECCRTGRGRGSVQIQEQWPMVLRKESLLELCLC